MLEHGLDIPCLSDHLPQGLLVMVLGRLEKGDLRKDSKGKLEVSF